MAGENMASIGSDAEAELAANISGTISTLFSADDVGETLAQVVALAVTTIEGCDYAGVYLAGAGAVAEPVCSDPVVVEIEARQHDRGEGPCLDAIDSGEAIYVNDLVDDDRWPEFGSAAARLGIRSLLSLPFATSGGPGALNLFACSPQAFGVIDRGRALLLAAITGVAATSARTHEDEKRRTANLHAALATREVIGQAQGILMEREHITPERAFDVLRRASQHLNVKLRDVARNLIETGERPETGT